jgi:hypothetical protein
LPDLAFHASSMQRFDIALQIADNRT